MIPDELRSCLGNESRLFLTESHSFIIWSLFSKCLVPGGWSYWSLSTIYHGRREKLGNFDHDHFMTGKFGVRQSFKCRKILWISHSQEQSAHWAVDVTAQVVLCWLGSWLNCNVWLVLGQWTQLAFQFIQLDITWVQCFNAADWMENQLGLLHLNSRVFPVFNQPTQLSIDRKLTEMMKYSACSEVGCFFWECSD